MTDVKEIVFSFDTTGSMYPCISEVRKGVKEMVETFFKEIPDVRIGIIAHGDYCDEEKTYLMQYVDLTDDKAKLIDFVNNVGDTYGGDWEEAYEFILHSAQDLSWSSNSLRSLVMIADAIPHNQKDSKKGLDWHKEVEELGKMGVSIYSVQCLYTGNASTYSFYKQMADKTNGYHLFLDQFRYIRDIMLAIVFKQGGDEKVEALEQEMTDSLGGLPRNIRAAFDVILKRKTSDEVKEDYATRYAWKGSSSSSRSSGTRKTVGSSAMTDEIEVDKLKPCAPSRFQMLDVDSDMAIKEFVLKNGLIFKTGRGFYEFTKPELISTKKEAVIMERATGDLYEGHDARKMIGLPDDANVKLKPSALADYMVFVQSTSYNRKLIGGTKFLYEVDYSR